MPHRLGSGRQRVAPSIAAALFSTMHSRTRQLLRFKCPGLERHGLRIRPLCVEFRFARHPLCFCSPLRSTLRLQCSTNRHARAFDRVCPYLILVELSMLQYLLEGIQQATQIINGPLSPSHDKLSPGTRLILPMQCQVVSEHHDQRNALSVSGSKLDERASERTGAAVCTTRETRGKFRTSICLSSDHRVS